MASQSIKALKIFYCCAPQDRALLNDLNVHLSGLKRQYELQTWHEDEIIPGVDREQEIDTHFSSAQIIFLLISPDFIASDYCEEQIKRALEKHREKSAHVIPILVRPAHLESTVLRHLQVLPRNGVAVVDHLDKDRAWLDVTREIRYVVENLMNTREIPKQSYRENRSAESILSGDTASNVKDSEVLLAQKSNVFSPVTKTDNFIDISTTINQAGQELVRSDNEPQTSSLGTTILTPLLVPPSKPANSLPQIFCKLPWCLVSGKVAPRHS